MKQNNKKLFYSEDEFDAEMNQDSLSDMQEEEEEDEVKFDDGDSPS